MVNNVFLFLSIIATVITIITAIFQLIKNKRTIKEWVLLVLLIVFISSTSYLAVENNHYNKVKDNAKNLLENWPRSENLKFSEIGELRGIIISGLAFIETNKDMFPNTNEQIRNLFIDEIGTMKKEKSDDRTLERQKLEDGAQTIIQLLEDISD